MGAQYTTVLVGGVVATYNDNPPADDGSQTAANRVKYATVTSDLTAPLHSAIQNMDGKLVTRFDEGPLTKSGNYTTVAGDFGKVIECSGTFTLSLLAAATAGAGYRIIAKNAGTGVVTVDVDGGGTIDGVSSIPVDPDGAVEVMVNDAAAEYMQIRDAAVFTPGTEMLFYQDTAPAGWTITSAVDEHSVRLTNGSGAGGQAGGTTGGTNNFSTQFALLAEGATPGVGNHTLTITEIPAHTHTTPTGLEGAGALGFTGTGASTSGALSGPAGGGVAHGHTVDLRVKWAACIIASKD